jgi:NADPH:quinone reductase-like Zn-dependent oxidoreductase
MQATMRAVQADSFGDPSVLRVRDVPRRGPRGDGAIVRMVATTVNPLDLEARRGELRFLRRPPIGTGLDVCGQVVAAGRYWKGPQVGREVWGVLGGFPVKHLMAAAEYVEVRAGWIVEAPTGIPLLDAAALPVAALTAHLGLRSLSLRSGDRLLIRGASGGVGTAAIQLARQSGAHVTALCSPRNDDLCLSLGAHETVDYHALDWDSLGPFDAAFDIVGGDDLQRLAGVVRKGGRVSAAVPDRPGFITASFLPGRVPVRPVVALPSRRRLSELTRLIDLGHLRPIIARRFPLAQIADAHRHLETDRAPGKRVVDIAP